MKNNRQGIMQRLAAVEPISVELNNYSDMMKVAKACKEFELIEDDLYKSFHGDDNFVPPDNMKGRYLITTTKGIQMAKTQTTTVSMAVFLSILTNVLIPVSNYDLLDEHEKRILSKMSLLIQAKPKSIEFDSELQTFDSIFHNAHINPLIERLMQQRDKLLREKLIQLGIGSIDFELEKRRRFKSFMREVKGDEETIYFDNGSEEGLRVLTIVTKPSRTDFGFEIHAY